METKTYTSAEEMASELNRGKVWWKEIYYTIYRFVYTLGMVPREILWFVQRGRRGYSDRDTWGLSWYLAWVISNGINQLREENHGCPYDVTKEEWDRILDKISLGFKHVVDAEENLDLWEDKKVMDEIKEGKQLFVEHFESLWD